MISRLTAYAAVFAVLSAATITFASNNAAQHGTSARAESAALPVIQLPRVEVIGRRVPKAA
jgi:hypothetical protein